MALHDVKIMSWPYWLPSWIFKDIGKMFCLTQNQCNTVGMDYNQENLQYFHRKE